ncbi:MAG: cytochrome bc complex cytochrome b subunit [Nitrospirae bacterium]|nr:cytochrome bc complex cytochrome b subunit [Nitrospirota bacterium]
MAKDAIEIFIENLKKLPLLFKQSLIRHDKPTSDRAKSQTVFSNIFLHIHSTRVHRYTLKPTFTFGLGIMAASSFMILCITGVILMVYYKPSVALAYDSIKDIQFIVPGGKFIRNLHRLATNIMIISVMLHMGRVFYTAAYKGERAFNWVLGVGLYIVTILLSFTGYLLPWDQLAYWAVTIGANIAASPREITDALGITSFFDIGGLTRTMILGSESIGQEALTRFYFIHIMVLPILLILLLSPHLWRVRKDGGLAKPENITEEDLVNTPKDSYSDKVFINAAPEKTYNLMCMVKGTSPAVGKGPENTVSSWPYLFTAEVGIFIFTLAICCLYALFVDAPLKEMANPMVPENPAKAPWYFLGVQELVSYSAFMGGVGIPTIVLIGLGLVPYLDREKQQLGRWFDDETGLLVAKKSAIFSAVTCIGTLIFLVAFGWLRNWFPHIPQLIIIVLNPGTVLLTAVILWSIHIMKTFQSTRLAAISLFTCFIVFFLILTYFAVYHRGPNWAFYWWPSMWPIH